MDLLTLNALDRASTVLFALAMAWLVISGKLVWHTQLQRELDRADRWERVALESLTTAAQAGVSAAQITADVVSAMPDPAARKDNQ